MSLINKNLIFFQQILLNKNKTYSFKQCNDIITYVQGDLAKASLSFLFPKRISALAFNVLLIWINLHRIV